MKNKNGITLVSLVVTIIVLIILAGVSINLTLGENGIITMAKKARENMELAKVDEERQLNELYEKIKTEGVVEDNSSNEETSKLAEFKKEIASAITDMGIETAENADATTMSSNIRSLTGASSADKVSYNNTKSDLAATNVQEAVDELDELNDNLEWKELTNGWTDYIAGSEFTLPDNVSELFVTWKNAHTSPMVSGVFPYIAVANNNVAFFANSRQDTNFQISIACTGNILKIASVPVTGYNNTLRIFYH